MTTSFSMASLTPTPPPSAPPNSSHASLTPSFSTSMPSFLPTTTFSPSSSFSTSTSPETSAFLNQTQCSVDESALRVPLAVIYSLFFIFGLVGNVFALWVFLFVHKNRNSVRVFLINCAVADLVLLACLPFRVFYHINGNRWVLGHVVCKIVGNLFYMNMYISIALLGLISLDRYLRLRGKGRARRAMRIRLWGHSKPWSWVACGVLWSGSLVATVPMIATAEDKENSNKCFHFKQRRNATGKAYFNAALVLMFWIVFLMLVVSYAKIASLLMQVSRDKPDLPNAQKFKRTAKKSFFVLFLFTLCFGPYHAFRPVYILSQLRGVSCGYMQLVDHTNEVMLLFSAFNSCLDPVMYFLLSGSIRKTVVQTLAHNFGSRFPFLTDATSNSSTVESRRPSMAMVYPDHTPSVTPRTSICVINTTLRRTAQQ
ncbi:probable G-protein coupled receptor 34 [Cololabis saira]|uniref:probable G-protein coupled receptor 34 n=1 Tax=Cololabis saira TaxID=129043 RepID=UPI002AD2B91B|nr:probable G-protein coupled receptor 34 [Cololabis saira]